MIGYPPVALVKQPREERVLCSFLGTSPAMTV
jgi:hypothetical protein